MPDERPDESITAEERAILQEITAPLAALPDDPVPLAADPEFPVALRGYDRLAVDAYVRKTSQLVAELQATRSPEAAVRRALERVGEEVSGVLQRAHEASARITAEARREAEARVKAAKREAAEIVAAADQRLIDLDAETDRIWEERRRIIEDVRELAAQLNLLAEQAAARFPVDEGELASADVGPFDQAEGAAEGGEGAAEAEEAAAEGEELAGPQPPEPPPAGPLEAAGSPDPAAVAEIAGRSEPDAMPEPTGPSEPGASSEPAASSEPDAPTLRVSRGPGPAGERE